MDLDLDQLADVLDRIGARWNNISSTENATKNAYENETQRLESRLRSVKQNCAGLEDLLEEQLVILKDMKQSIAATEKQKQKTEEKLEMLETENAKALEEYGLIERSIKEENQAIRDLHEMFYRALGLRIEDPKESIYKYAYLYRNDSSDDVVMMQFAEGSVGLEIKPLQITPDLPIFHRMVRKTDPKKLLPLVAACRNYAFPSNAENRRADDNKLKRTNEPCDAPENFT